MSEFLGGKLNLPQARNRTSRVAQREEELLADMKTRLERVGGYEEHRGAAFDRHILPRCRSLAEAIGHRMAYEAAESAGLSLDVLLLYERICLCEDLDPMPAPVRAAQVYAPSRASESYNAVLAQIRSESASQSDIDEYVIAPITSDESWEAFMNSLRAFRNPDDIPVLPSKL